MAATQPLALLRGQVTGFLAFAQVARLRAGRIHRLEIRIDGCAGAGAAAAALRGLVEGTGYTLTAEGRFHALGGYYSLPSETNKDRHLYLATPVQLPGPAHGEAEIETYFDMSVVFTMPFDEAVAQVGKTIHGLETVGAMLLAQHQLEKLRGRTGDERPITSDAMRGEVRASPRTSRLAERAATRGERGPPELRCDLGMSDDGPHA
ncbi:hypothetical protein ACPPVO_06405 [Dactylosporangium sp. McL0621]|uniref:hypothetical protein n=1 Tax=Dactylosporangium sp. McL0621 TaxID=3415678 RepID=UPI003CF24044